MGRVRGPHTQEAPEAKGRLKAMLNRPLTPRLAAVAGPATHLSGLFYLIAVNVIAASDLRAVRGTLDVATYNAVWFAIPLLALVMCIVEPTAARAAVWSAERWARAHSRSLLLFVSFSVGTALVVCGALAA